MNMAMTLSVYTIGGSDLIQDIFNSVAMAFNDPISIGAITSLAILLGGLFTVLEFTKSKDIKILIKWMGMYLVITSLMLYPKATVVIEDRSGIDMKPRIIDHVPLSLAVFANLTSRIGIGITEVIETVFHLPEDMAYNKTGMLMGSRLVMASREFQITDPNFTQTLNEFMQQCVFFDLLLKKYTIQELVHADNPWEFIKNNTSQARAFPLEGEITVCRVGASQLDKKWHDIVNHAASVYGGQMMAANSHPAKALLSHLSEGYSFLTEVSVQGEAILKTNLLSNAISNAMTHYGANVNAPAALQAYEATKSELQARETMDQTGRQAAVWMQYFKNIIEAVIYASFIFIYFLSYFPFGTAIVKNYICGMFFIQFLAPMYAIINFAANSYAHLRSVMFIQADQTHSGLSIANIAGITQANADAMAVAGYLMWPVTLGGAIMIFRSLPSAVQSMGQLIGGVVQHSSNHTASEAIGGNISAGNASFGNHSSNNNNANHWDTNARYSAGSATLQTSTGSSLTITSSGSEVLNNQGGISNLGVSVHMAESMRSAASQQMQSSLSAMLNRSQSAGEQYGSAFRQMYDYSQQHSHFKSSGESFSDTKTTGLSQSSSDVAQYVDSFAKEHNVSHERAAQVLGQAYADAKIGGGFIAKGEVGASLTGSSSGRSAFGSLYNDAYRISSDKHFSDVVDKANRESHETHFRDNTDEGNRLAHSISSSFDKGDSYRTEASSQLSQAQSYSQLASLSTENAASINSNYTQEFYEWMRNQPAPSSQYGQGTWSKSAIDDMAIHNPAGLQSYADRFVHEKTGEAMHDFERKNHLSHGENTVHQSYQKDQSYVHQQSQSEKHYQQFNQELHHEIQRHPTTGMNGANGQLGGDANMIVGHTNESVKTTVDQKMVDHQEQLDSRQGDLSQLSEPLKSRVNEKIKGQVMGSLNPVIDAKKAMSHLVSQEES